MKRSSKHRVFQIQIVIIVLVALGIAASRLIWQYNPALVATLFRSNDPTEIQCAEILAPDASLSRNQTLKLISIAESSSKASVRAILKMPYCRLNPITIRSGVKADREAYPLASDPMLWAIVLYEGNEFVGVRIVPRNGSCTNASP
ncbi:hypothetical protein ACQ4M3_06270 [Leptolyngbya sp. AN03gr2]|uniref:hypothetical protein n=1 Tax=unclassified Leptolyngbya TaxID=2650499 RepID=UPI003D317B34